MSRLRRLVRRLLSRDQRALAVFEDTANVAGQMTRFDGLKRKPAGVVGLGRGEIAAAYAAGVLSREDALSLAEGSAPDVVAGEPRLPLYLGATGGRVDKGASLDSRYWQWVMQAPVRTDVIRVACADGYDRCRAIGDRGWKDRPLIAPVSPLDLSHPSVARDPYPFYETLRASGNVHFLPRENAWLLLGYDDVRHAFAHPELFSNAPYRDVDEVLLGSDPPAHAEARRLVSPLFAPEVVEQLGAFADARAAALLQRRFDVVRQYGLPLSESVAAHFLGLDGDAVDEIRSAHARAPELGPFTRALDAIAPRAALYPKLREAGVADAAARSLVRLLWLAATTTTERVIARSILRLAQHDDVRAALARDLSLVPAFVEEILRLHPPEHAVPRLARAAVTIGGTTVPAGALVYLGVAAANRDPAIFPDAVQLRLDRPPTRHFAFGFGLHHCVGASVARRVVAAAVRTLLQNAPDFRAAQPLNTAVHWCTLTATPVEQLIIETRAEPA
jgi:cytochrome P450